MRLPPYPSHIYRAERSPLTIEVQKMSVKDKVNAALDAGERLEFLASILGGINTLLGKTKPENASSLVKGFLGLLGYGDEGVQEVLIDHLEKTPGYEDARAMFVGFFEWHFPKGTLDQSLVSWYYQNKFRTFVAKLGENDDHEVGVVKIKTTASRTGKNGAKIESERVVERKIRAESINNSLDFLKMMIRVIKANVRVTTQVTVFRGHEIITPPIDYTEGYKELIRQFIALGYPTVPEKAVDVVGAIRGATTRVIGTTGSLAVETLQKSINLVQDSPVLVENARLVAENELAQRRGRNHSWLGRLIRK